MILQKVLLIVLLSCFLQQINAEDKRIQYYYITAEAESPKQITVCVKTSDKPDSITSANLNIDYEEKNQFDLTTDGSDNTNDGCYTFDDTNDELKTDKAKFVLKLIVPDKIEINFVPVNVFVNVDDNLSGATAIYYTPEKILRLVNKDGSEPNGYFDDEDYIKCNKICSTTKDLTADDNLRICNTVEDGELPFCNPDTTPVLPILCDGTVTYDSIEYYVDGPEFIISPDPPTVNIITKLGPCLDDVTCITVTGEKNDLFVVDETTCEKADLIGTNMEITSIFEDALEIKWTNAAVAKEYYLINEQGPENLANNIHIDCSSINPDALCYAYAFHDKGDVFDNTKFILAEYDETSSKGKKIKASKTYSDSTSRSKSLKNLSTINLDISWNYLADSAEGTVCVSDPYMSTRSIIHQYELIIANKDGKWKKMTNYQVNNGNDICFENFKFDTDTFVHNSEVKVLALKRNTETHSVVGSSSATTQLTIPKLKLLSKNVAKIETEELHEDFEIRDLATGKIMIKDARDHSHTAYIKRDEGLSDRQFVLEVPQKDQIKTKIHFKTPHKNTISPRHHS